VVTVVLARVVHGERLARIQQAGVAGALVGVALIAAG
jgi:drug/metabolite transporter (DMT)-like permease